LRLIPSNQGGELMKEEEKDGKGDRSYEDEAVGGL
jgi:hypothetical protein